MSSNVSFVWEDPPPSSAGRPNVWEGRLAPLRQYPGKWARFDGVAASAGTSINKGKVGGINPGEFSACTRSIDGKQRLFVKFNGDG